MTIHMNRLSITGLAAMALVWAAQASAVEFSFDATFESDNGVTVIGFPLQLAAVQQSEVIDFTIFLKSNDNGDTMLTDVTTLGCSVSAAYTSRTDFMTSEYLTNATYTATCDTNISAGEEGRLVIDIVNDEPMIMVGGPRMLAAGDLYKIGWAHDGNYFMCQPFTLGGSTNPTWWPVNQGLSNMIANNPVGSVEFAVPASAQFALQCISDDASVIPAFLAVEAIVDDEP